MPRRHGGSGGGSAVGLPNAGKVFPYSPLQAARSVDRQAWCRFRAPAFLWRLDPSFHSQVEVRGRVAVARFVAVAGSRTELEPAIDDCADLGREPELTDHPEHHASADQHLTVLESRTRREAGSFVETEVVAVAISGHVEIEALARLVFELATQTAALEPQPR